MTITATRDYLKLIWRQYQVASFEEKSLLLNELCRNLNIHRKSAIRLLNKNYPPRSLQGFRGGRTRKYSYKAKSHLKELWKKMGYMCGVRMKEALPEWIEFYDHKDFDVSIKNEILAMSVSSINRFLTDARRQHKRKINSGTRKGPVRFMTIVPVRNFESPPTEVGHCEIDCVAHCGGNMSGEFAWTLTLTDIVSGQTECESVFGKSGYAIRKALEDIEKRLPFSLTALYFDNGTEFLNEEVVQKFCRKNREKPILCFRGRPYRKNDQCYVEQKNYTHVRCLFGYSRLDQVQCVHKMNELYRKEWRLLQNFFMPQQKLVSKHRQGSKQIRVMDRPQTPYKRLKDHLSEEEYKKLISQKNNLNPIRLQESLKLKLRSFFKYYSTEILESEWSKMAS